jgi:glycosyltransferase involved in cell wall biosynthesis
MNPLVSIIIPSYNREHIIEKTLDSVLSQTYHNWECIVVDDQSIDNTDELFKPYTQKDKRIKYFRRPKYKKRGASSCRNYGLEKAKGKLIQFLDSDDLLAKNKLEEQVKIYKPGSITLITCKWGGFEESSDLAKRFKYSYHSYKNFKKGKHLLNTFGKYNEFFPLHVYLTPKTLIEKSGNWNEDLTNNDDAEFFARVILNSSGILFSDKTSVYYRYNSVNNLSEIDSPEKVESAIKSWKLIKSYLEQEGFRGNCYYVKTGKLILYNAIKNTYPEMVLDNREFFKGNNSYFSYLRELLKEIGLLRS